ncbi:TrmB family transcriptional regulator [Halosegnis marinus]|uniref:TrmB family transcriptional regulator n=1 Tax=Halosegnis marinus TaxID=3034023 RepID=A0ABD5ZMB2_9EURY|nr:helix-turn-helix domain-containing protein [Halosegnis sp. DT85]
MADLRDLGLSEYEERTYRALLDSGATTAKELSRDSDVPMGRIYDVLNSLEQYDLVRSQTASRPKKYAAVEPNTALDRLLDDKKRELEAKRTQYEEIVSELQGELESADPPEETFWTAAVGGDETAELLVERVAAADDSVVMCLSAYTPQLFDIDRYGTEILDELVGAVERGATVKLLMRRELVPTLPEEIGRRYRKALAAHDRFEVRTVAELSGTFTLVDGVETVVEVPHPLDREETFGVIDLKDRAFAASVREPFEPRWAEAEPLVL